MTPGHRRHLAYLASEDWYFADHFLPLAVAARDAGWRISLLARTGERGSTAARRITAEGIELEEIPFRRGSINPLADLATVIAIRSAYRRRAPDLVHHIALKPILYGQAAARPGGITARVNTLPGLGFVYSSGSATARLLRPLVTAAIAMALRGERGIVVLNRDHRDWLARVTGVPADRIAVVPGVGVDIARLRPAPEPCGPIVVTCVARMLRDKGIGELVAAARILRARGVGCTVRLVGAPDPQNPATHTEAELRRWHDEGAIDWQGRRDDLAAVWAESHIAVLPSWGEGFGMSLAEAAACGRPLVATDVPGCRDVVRHGETGLLVAPHDVPALAQAIAALVGDGALRRRYGAAARADAERRMASGVVHAQMLAIYRAAVAPAS